MKIYSYVTTILLSFSVCLVLTAQPAEPSFRKYSSRQGLSSATVYDILKDSFGFIWLATEDGLNRFDGTNFKAYRHDPARPNSLKANHITSLFESRNGRIWIGTNGGGLSIYERTQDSISNYSSGGPGQPGVGITAIHGDKDGHVWVCSYGGLYIIDPETGKQLTGGKYKPLLSELSGKVSLCFLEDSRSNIWVGTHEGLYWYDPQRQQLKHFVHKNGDTSGLPHNIVNKIVEEKNGTIWVGTDNGLARFLTEQSAFRNYSARSSPFKLSSGIIFTLEADNKGRLWIGTEMGLNILETATGQLTVCLPEKRNPRSISGRSIRSILVDNQGIYWVGTFGGGLNKYDENFNYFGLKEYSPFDPFGLRSPVVTSFAGHNNDVFVGTDGGGLHLYHRNTGLLDPINLPFTNNSDNTKSGLTILALEMAGNNKLWVGTYTDGIYRYDPANGTHQHYSKGEGPGNLTSDNIFCLLEDRRGNIWVGTNGGGINIIPPSGPITRFLHDPEKENDPARPASRFIRAFEEDKAGRIWIGTYGAGISVVDPAGGNPRYYTKANSRLPGDYILSILEDSQGNVWAGTGGNGVGLLKKGAGTFETLSEKDGLANGMVYKIIEDQSGKIWISTNNGLSCYDPATGRFKNYSVNEGLQAGAFTRGAGIMMPDGALFFGGQNGFNYFNPANLKTNRNVPEVVLTDLKVDNRSVSPSPKGPIEKSILLADEISLKYQQGFSIAFEALDFTVPEANQYEYKLEGLDRDWIKVGKEHSVYFANIPPGNYTFRVRASNNDGVWNETGRAIRIHVDPPLWRSIYAYVLYLLLALGIMLYLRRLGIRKIRTRFELEQERQKAKELIERERKEAEYLHKLDQIKIKFLTNLSHEFRTPISLITGPVETLIGHVKEEPHAGQLGLIRRNARRLLNLVNQLLDFRKMEERELKLQRSEGNIIAFMKDVCDSFQDLARRKKIELRFESEVPEAHTLFDHDKIERILFNILSNAFKFTPENGRINIRVEAVPVPETNSDVHLKVSVSDTGIGIPEEARERIFESFFQHETTPDILNHGTGIGLAITKEFVQLHGGRITVESKVGRGSTFSFDLSLEKAGGETQPVVLPESLIAENVQGSVPAATASVDHSLPCILIVEDDEDFRFYIRENLRSLYRIVEAADGKAGWEQALLHHPDIVVSDVQMPVMNGLELAQKLKSDKKTKNIPVILLTAANTPDNVLYGLESGAIDYMTKPFDFAVLQAKLHNILLLNQSFKDTYSKKVTVGLPKSEVLSEREEFLQKALNFIYENLDNQQLSVEVLSTHLFISRASLYNKLMEYVGVTPVEFIRSVKLEKAKELLERTDKTITEVAYETGFTNANYFTKVFRAAYHMTPSEFRAEKKK
ncbi:two-component regulator propeller domain-containing protein [Parasegetibacter sp. NRK P23]|uniref:hybrid sensor histidine kinase/response regulator transcription factor n=1 Tax=Parasegetibacter sp. NRK P23 TaxID=2942999 RepID=UPI00204468B3|nr:two-component regulator propeller domain-containing protein [Parasegetibacter sp. NRK P23]MCM5529339.1 ATP-binding protein [Parasegetibacter sp. NRK P23]